MKTLIAYFTWGGNTKRIVNTLSQYIDCDIYQIDRETPYSRDYNECAYHEAKDETDQKINPPIKKPLPDITPYDKIILAFPIWWYTAPRVIFTFLQSIDFQGKDIYIFANSYTNDPNYMVHSLNDTKQFVNNGHIKRGLFNNEINTLESFINENLNKR